MRQYTIKALVDGAMVLGLVLHKGQGVTVDVEDARAASFQSLVDAGVLEIDGMKPSPAPAADDKKASKK